MTVKGEASQHNQLSRMTRLSKKISHRCKRDRLYKNEDYEVTEPYLLSKQRSQNFATTEHRYEYFKGEG